MLIDDILKTIIRSDNETKYAKRNYKTISYDKPRFLPSGCKQLYKTNGLVDQITTYCLSFCRM